jgi:hypothetical protein
MASLQALARCLAGKPGWGLVISDRAKGSYGNVVAKALLGMGASGMRVSLGALDPCRAPSPASAVKQTVRSYANPAPSQGGLDCAAVNRRVELQLVPPKASKVPSPPTNLRAGPSGY